MEIRHAVLSAADVDLFLFGMMLLAEVARREGLFDTVAALAVNLARGSAWRLFALTYGAGVIITVFLSNDAAAVVLTPAVFAAARRARTDPLPHLYACAFVANAASFVLPISNPANLVLYADRPPALADWVAAFAAPSLAAIAATFAALLLVQRNRLASPCEPAADAPAMDRKAWVLTGALGAAVAVMLAASALAWPLGPPTAAAGVAVALARSLTRRASPWPLLRGVAWKVLLLVIALFAGVAVLEELGAIGWLAGRLQDAIAGGTASAAWIAGGAIAALDNCVNNLPAGLMASATALKAAAPRPVVDALLIGVDLGPNLSLSGSLASLLWLAAIRREGERVSGWRFFKVGAIVAPPALVLALAARLAFR